MTIQGRGRSLSYVRAGFCPLPLPRVPPHTCSVSGQGGSKSQKKLCSRSQMGRSRGSAKEPALGRRRASERWEGKGGGGWRNQLGQAGGLGVGEREEEGSRNKQTLRVTYKGAEGTRRHTQDSGQETRPHGRDATVRAWGAGCGGGKQVTAHRTQCSGLLPQRHCLLGWQTGCQGDMLVTCPDPVLVRL